MVRSFGKSSLAKGGRRATQLVIWIQSDGGSQAAQAVGACLVGGSRGATISSTIGIAVTKCSKSRALVRYDVVGSTIIIVAIISVIVVIIVSKSLIIVAINQYCSTVHLPSGRWRRQQSIHLGWGLSSRGVLVSRDTLLECIKTRGKAVVLSATLAILSATAAILSFISGRVVRVICP
jgi:hypothetical protein